MPLEELKERQGLDTWGSSLIGEEDSWDKGGGSGTIRRKVIQLRSVASVMQSEVYTDETCHNPALSSLR